LLSLDFYCCFRPPLFGISFRLRISVFYVLPLYGVTTELPLALSIRSIIDGDLQKALASRMSEKIPLRPLLVRVNNQVLYSLFHELGSHSVAEGAPASPARCTLSDGGVADAGRTPTLDEARRPRRFGLLE
jgi:hypothetical protein